MAPGRRDVLRWGWLGAVLAAACGGGTFSADSPGTSGGSGGSSAGDAAAAGNGGGPQAGAGGKPSAAGAAPGGRDNPPGSGGEEPLGGASGEAGAASGGEAGSGSTEPEPPISLDGLVYWFKADAGVVETSGRISRWGDQSGAARDAVQGLAGQQPKLTKADALALPVVEFDGKSRFELPPIDAPLERGLTFFLVGGRASDNVCTAFLELSNGQGVDDVFFGARSKAAHFEVHGTWYDTPQVYDYGNLNQLTMKQDSDTISTKVEIRLDGAFIGSGPVSFAERLEREQNFIGHTQYKDCTTLVGAIGELILYARPLPRAEQLAVEAYLQQKWQLSP